MTPELFIMTCVLFVTGATCGPAAEAASLIARSRMPAAAVYPQPSSFQSSLRRYLYGHLLVEPDDADYSTTDNSAAPVAKRTGNGAWIWMPAQGYVSVSKNQQASAGDVSGKHGRIMRYGK